MAWVGAGRVGVGFPERDAGGSLIVSGGGSTLVGTDTLLAQEAATRRLHAAALDWQATLGRIRRLNSVPSPAWSSSDPGLDVLAATIAIDSVETQCRRLADALHTASEGYARAERQAEDAARATGASLGWMIGRFPQLAALLALSALPVLTTGGVVWLLGQAYAQAGRSGAGVWRRPLVTPLLTGIDSFRLAPAVLPAAGAGSAARRSRPGARGAGAATTPKTEHGEDSPVDPRLLTSPLAAALVRIAVSSLDDIAVGALGLPLPIAKALGDDGAGMLGVTTSAAGLLAVARPGGLLRETPVTVAPVAPVAQGHTAAPSAAPMPGNQAASAALRGSTGGSTGGMMGGTPGAPPGLATASPPTGLADLAARIPDLKQDGGQVRVERYGDDGAAAWVVYVGGTVDWSPVAATEPWDLTSNLAAVAEEEAGSYRAVVQAMREAGIQPGEPVIEVGHSQGGLIAAQVAASGEFTSVATVTFGAPSGSVPVPVGVDTVAVEHTDDIVPGMGGTSDAATARLVVRREVYTLDPIPEDVALPAHSMTNYLETARQIDSSPEPRLRAFREQLTSVVGSSDGIAGVWRGTRSVAE